MKQWMKIVATFLGLGLIAGASFAIEPEADDISPFLGVDYYRVWMKSRNGWDSIFPNQYPIGASFYVGTKFHQNFGLELAYDWSQHQKRNWELLPGSSFFGKTVATKLTGTTKVQRNGGHLDLLAFLPVADCFELLGSIGVGWLQTKIESTMVSASGAATFESVALTSVSGNGRPVLRVGIGGLYMLTDMVGVRGKIGFEGTSALRVEGNSLFTEGNYNEKPFKGSTTLSLGAFFKF